MFTLGEAHLNLLKQAVVLWAPVEAGAPAILFSPLQLGAEDEIPYEDVAARAGLSVNHPPSEADRRRLDRLIQELPEALAQLLARGRLEPGTYTYRNPLVDFPFAAETLPAELATLATSAVVSFAFTAQHAALLRGADWRQLAMNPKRPYGDMTCFELDMARILGEPGPRTGPARLSAEQERRLQALHAETLPALQVHLEHARLAPGEYEPLPAQ